MLPFTLIWLFAIVVMMLAIDCEASIQIVATNKTYESRPDKDIGESMAEGTEYYARLQQLPGNYHLCYDKVHPESQNWSVTVPDDGSPGMCSLEN